MFAFMSKILDMWGAPFFGTPVHFTLMQDEWTGKQIKNYDAVRLSALKIAPNHSNRVHEGIEWYWRQPAFMKHKDFMWIGTFFPWLFGFRQPQEVGWVTMR